MNARTLRYPSPVVAAHTGMDGLVYFDVRSEWDLLQTAHCTCRISRA